MTGVRERYNDLRRARSDLKLEGLTAEQIPIQLAVVELAKELKSAKELSSAWNTLASLYNQTQQYELAEQAAKQSISTWKKDWNHAHESLATFEWLLASILAAQHRFDEAVEVSDYCIKHFSVFHDSDSNFLKARIAEFERMRNFRSFNQPDKG